MTPTSNVIIANILEYRKGVKFVNPARLAFHPVHAMMAHNTIVGKAIGLNPSKPIMPIPTIAIPTKIITVNHAQILINVVML